MSNSDNVAFCRTMLRNIRKEAREARVKIPKRLTALKSSVGDWWLVEGDGFRSEVCADNAYDARSKVISHLIDTSKKEVS